jgi:hypothetical protein
MPRTHKQNAARKLADSLEIPYQRALDAIEEAIAGAYPSMSSVRNPAVLPSAIPSIYTEWVENFRFMIAANDRFLSSVSRSDLRVSDLENLAILECEMYELLERLYKSDAFVHQPQVDIFLDCAVVLAAQGQFLGYQSPKFLEGDIELVTSVWLALVRQGFAEKRDPKSEPNGMWVVLTERGFDAFMVRNSGAWNENMFLLLEPCLPADEQRDWIREMKTAYAHNRGEN